jgi:hypothetical protein
MKSFIALLFVLLFVIAGFNAPSYKIAQLKYNGGGDWYANRTALPNLIAFCNKNIGTNFDDQPVNVEVGSADIFNYPFVYMTGHGNVLFSDQEAQNLRKYLIGGGFLHIDDNYGLNKFARQEMKKVFPELDFIELPTNHPIYSNQKFKFPAGLPKIHEHDGLPAKGFGIIYKGRLVCFFDFECDLGNGWEDLGTYSDDKEATRQKALQMGANLVQYALTQ